MKFKLGHFVEMDCWSNWLHTGKIHFFIFIAIVVILLLNLLIAMMGDTYAKIAEIKNEWMRQVMKMLVVFVYMEKMVGGTYAKIDEIKNKWMPHVPGQIYVEGDYNEL